MCGRTLTLMIRNNNKITLYSPSYASMLYLIDLKASIQVNF